MLPDQGDDTSPGKVNLGTSTFKEVALPTKDCLSCRVNERASMGRSLSKGV